MNRPHEQQNKYQKCVEEIEKWALRMVNCSHALCSIAEASYEEMFGQQALDIINKYKSLNQTGGESKSCRLIEIVTKEEKEEDNG
jgi:hypothetical protein